MKDVKTSDKIKLLNEMLEKNRAEGGSETQELYDSICNQAEKIAGSVTLESRALVAVWIKFIMRLTDRLGQGGIVRILPEIGAFQQAITAFIIDREVRLKGEMQAADDDKSRLN